MKKVLFLVVTLMSLTSFASDLTSQLNGNKILQGLKLGVEAQHGVSCREIQNIKQAKEVINENYSVNTFSANVVCLSTSEDEFAVIINLKGQTFESNDEVGITFENIEFQFAG